jgi:N-acetylglutamate synthase-like GNAT family acetyltransferase
VSSNIDEERSGLIVEPNYQKLGLGRRLLENDNEMADQAGAKTWVSASVNSKRLFESLGFVQLVEESLDHLVSFLEGERQQKYREAAKHQ